MPVTTRKPTGGKLPLGRDHKLDCVLTWNDGTHPDTINDVDVFYATIKVSDADADTAAVVELNSTDDADQFIVADAAAGLAGELVFWLKVADQENIVADTEKYVFSLDVKLTDGTLWPFVLDYNLMFAKTANDEPGD
jgi:hypothetical protein